MPTGLADLDELVLECRDSNARSNVKEAVLAYRAGAFRAAIVATWVAVAYDYLAKLRELSLAGDAQAQASVDEFEKIQAAGNLSAALKWERELLESAHSSFELLSPLELVDLKRLQEDRHRCAHPSMASLETPYLPSAELARTHLRNAVTIMLGRPPVQGKAALERILKEVGSQYFPSDVEEAVHHFEHGPLHRPRDSLIRNLTVVLMKHILDPDNDIAGRHATALKALLEMHRATSIRAVGEGLPDLARARMSTEVSVVAKLVRLVPEVWASVPVDVEQMLQKYVEQMPAGDLLDLDDFLHLDGLRASALKRVRRATAKELVTRHFWDDDDPDILSRKLELYSQAGSFEAANELGGALADDAKNFTADHVDQVVEAVSNSQVRGSFELKTLLRSIINASHLTPDELDDKLSARGLPKFAEL